MPAKPKKKPHSRGRPNRGTPRSSYRLEPETLARLTAIQALAALDSQADAIRYAARVALEALERAPVPKHGPPV